MLELAARGSHVALNYNRSEDDAIDTERCAAAFGVRSLRVQGDAGDPSAAARMNEVVEETLGPIDYLVSCAGVFRRTPVETVVEADWRDMMHGNFETFRAAAAAVAPGMKRRGSGAIVAFGDVAAVRPWSEYLPYCVSKSCVLAHARELARALAPQVRVNAVLPGPVLFPPDYPAESSESEIRRTLLKRRGHGEDIARAVAYLLDNDYVTGAELPVDGGRLLV